MFDVIVNGKRKEIIISSAKLFGVLTLALIFCASASGNIVSASAANLTGNVSIANISVNSTGYGEVINISAANHTLIQIWIEPVAIQTEVFVGSDEGGIAIWEGENKSCWIDIEGIDIYIDTGSEIDFGIWGRFVNMEKNVLLCFVNVEAVREEHREATRNV